MQRSNWEQAFVGGMWVNPNLVRATLGLSIAAIAAGGCTNAVSKISGSTSSSVAADAAGSSSSIPPSSASAGATASGGAPAIGACFVLPDGTADAQVPFPSTTPRLEAFVTFIDNTSGSAVFPDADALNEDGKYEAARGGFVTSGDSIQCQIEKVLDLRNGGTVVSGPVVAKGPILENYGVGNGNTPW